MMCNRSLNYIIKVVVMTIALTGGFSGLSLAGQPQPNYDPPQPSTDFGTPEATAKIAAKAGFLDVVGVKLGVPVKVALDAVKAHNPDIKMEPKAKLEFEA